MIYQKWKFNGKLSACMYAILAFRIFQLEIMHLQVQRRGCKRYVLLNRSEYLSEPIRDAWKKFRKEKTNPHPIRMHADNEKNKGDIYGLQGKSPKLQLSAYIFISRLKIRRGAVRVNNPPPPQTNRRPCSYNFFCSLWILHRNDKKLRKQHTFT